MGAAAKHLARRQGGGVKWWGHVSGLERIDAVYDPPMRAQNTIEEDEWCRVDDGWVMVIFSPVMVIDGVLRLDGIVRVEHEKT